MLGFGGLICIAKYFPLAAWPGIPLSSCVMVSRLRSTYSRTAWTPLHVGALTGLPRVGGRDPVLPSFSCLPLLQYGFDILIITATAKIPLCFINPEENTISADAVGILQQLSVLPVSPGKNIFLSSEQCLPLQASSLSNKRSTSPNL
nr:uncharacterized protein LOC129017535 [Pongo pygmaeus]